MKDNNNYNNKFRKNINNDESRKVEREYSYYSKVLNKPFDSIGELKEAEAAYYEAQRIKEDKAAQKKADAKKVEDAFKGLNAARKEYKEKFAQLTTEYAEALENLKKAFDLGKKEIHDTLATAEDNYSKALKEFTDAHPEGYHVTLKDGDFETTISKQVSNSKTTNIPKTSDLFDLFDWMLKF